MGSLQPDHTGREFLRAVIRPKPSNGAGFSRKVIVFGEVSEACSAKGKRPSPQRPSGRQESSVGAGLRQIARNLEDAADPSSPGER